MQTYNFYILGMPRSRTAWLSWFMSGKDVFCGHDFFSYPPNTIDTLENIKGFKYRGSVDTNPLNATNFLKDIGSPLVIIKRDKDEVINSLENQFNIDDDLFIKDAVNKMSIQLDSLEPFADLIVPFKEINDYLEKIFKTCCPTIDIDKYKLEIFKHYKVEVTGLDYNAFKKGVEKTWQQH